MGKDDERNVLVVSNESSNVPMLTVLGVTLPARVWRDAAAGLQYLQEGRIDSVLHYRQGTRIKTKNQTITRNPIR